MNDNYKQMMSEVLAEKLGSIEGIKKQIAEREGQSSGLMNRINIAPLAAVIDSQNGTNVASQLQGPTPHDKNQMIVDKLQQALQKQKDDYGDEAMAYFKNKTYMDQVKAQTDGASENRAFDQWYKKQILEDKDLDREAAMLKAQRKGSAKKSFTKDETNAAGFGKRMLQAEAIFGDLTDGGYDRGTRGEQMSTWLPKEFQGENLRKQDQAERNFINANLRRESGAAISAQEFSNAEEQYFPRPGDTEEVLAYKRANRMQAVEALKLGAGEAWEALPFINPLQDGLAPKSRPREGFVRMTNGSETIDVPVADAQEAMQEGFKRAE